MLTVADAAANPTGFDPFNPAAFSAGALPGITPFKPKVDQQEPLKSEIVSFLTAVRQRSQPEVTLGDGRRALAVALQVVEAIATHAERTHLREMTTTRN